MKNANEFFSGFKNNLVGGLNTCLIGQIEHFDPERMSADVILLPDNELILDVPVGIQQTTDFYIRVPYKRGDFVLVVFSQRDIDGIMNNGDATPSQRMLSKDDAIIVCGLNPYDAPKLPATDPNDLVIGKKNGGSKIVLKSANNDIDVTCNQFRINGRVI